MGVSKWVRLEVRCCQQDPQWGLPTQGTFSDLISSSRESGPVNDGVADQDRLRPAQTKGGFREISCTPNFVTRLSATGRVPIFGVSSFAEVFARISGVKDGACQDLVEFQTLSAFTTQRALLARSRVDTGHSSPWNTLLVEMTLTIPGLDFARRRLANQLEKPEDAPSSRRDPRQ